MTLASVAEGSSYDPLPGLIILVPLVSATVLLLCGRRLGRRAGTLGTVTIGASFLMA